MTKKIINTISIISHMSYQVKTKRKKYYTELRTTQELTHLLHQRAQCLNGPLDLVNRSRDPSHTSLHVT